MGKHFSRLVLLIVVMGTGPARADAPKVAIDAQVRAQIDAARAQSDRIRGRNDEDRNYRNGTRSRR